MLDTWTIILTEDTARDISVVFDVIDLYAANVTSFRGRYDVGKLMQDLRSTGPLSKFGLESLMAGCADAYGTASSITTTMLESEAIWAR